MKVVFKTLFLALALQSWVTQQWKRARLGCFPHMQEPAVRIRLTVPSRRLAPQYILNALRKTLIFVRGTPRFSET